MLFIDPGRSVTSLRPNAMPYPYSPKVFRGGMMEVSDFLARAGSPERLLPHLLNELRDLGTLQRVAASLPSQVVRMAAQAIAFGLIAVGVPLTGNNTLLFQQRVAEAPHDDDAVRFAGVDAAGQFFARCLVTRTSKAAADALMAHPRAADHPWTQGAGGLPMLLAGLLMSRRIGLFPIDGSRDSELRISWIHQNPLTVVVAPPPPPPPPSSSVAQIIQAVEDTLAALPAELSAQAQALIDAALAGTPFCEECPRTGADAGSV